MFYASSPQTPYSCCRGNCFVQCVMISVYSTQVVDENCSVQRVMTTLYSRNDTHAVDETVLYNV